MNLNPTSKTATREILWPIVRPHMPLLTDAEIESACRRAKAWEFIPKLAEGLDTRVGEGGSNRNGGPRLATDRNCPRSLFLRNGQIQQAGSYDSLVTIPGRFRELVEGQQISIS
ncbi:MAG: hypothetical protein CAK90_01325 [Spartobacteria bacterium AMD-G4]|nr:MAG: hypothetical protein CAK90_01325 [Spartobacteria bacterium AMD-G4]